MIIRPKEILTFKYWFHLIGIVILILFILNMFMNIHYFTIKNVLIGTGLFAGADIFMHTVIGLD